MRAKREQGSCGEGGKLRKNVPLGDVDSCCVCSHQCRQIRTWNEKAIKGGCSTCCLPPLRICSKVFGEKGFIVPDGAGPAGIRRESGSNFIAVNPRPHDQILVSHVLLGLTRGIADGSQIMQRPNYVPF